jgi:hypothetical protein
MSKEKIAYHRILLKLSGEALANGKQGLYDWELIDQICARIKTLVADGVQVGPQCGVPQSLDGSSKYVIGSPAMSMKDMAAITLAPKMIQKLKAEIKEI